MATQAADIEALYAWGQSTWSARTWRALKRFVRTQPLGTAGAIVVFAILVAAIFQGLISTSDPTSFDGDVLVGPSSTHFFGTNREGQDVWSRVIYGARPALQIGVGAVALSLLVGVTLALIAGFAGGIWDTVISRIVEIFICLPALLWALFLRNGLAKYQDNSYLGLDGSIAILIVAISVGLIPIITRILRGNVLQEKSRQYVEAAQVVGATNFRIMFRHILPNLAPLIIVVGSATIPAAILAESGLSFLGLGLPSGDPSWGADLGGKARTLFRTYWWLPIFPGLALSLTVLAFNLLGDSLRDTLDPRLRGR